MASLVYLKGGIPAHVNHATASGSVVEEWGWEGGPANYLWFKNTGTGALILSFRRVDADAGIGLTLASGAIWEGPAEIGGFYTQSSAAEAFEALAFIRR